MTVHTLLIQLALSAMPAVVLLFLLLGHALAVAPEDEDATCAVPHYPANIRILLDSWRYQTLLDQNDSAAVWTAASIGEDRMNAVSKIKS